MRPRACWVTSNHVQGGTTMAGTMRAFVIKQVGETEVVDKPIPKPGPEEAVVRTTAALICTSDVHTVKGALPVPAGRTLGHESVGVIHKLGSAVTGYEKGQRVAVNAVTPCYRCSYCQRGFTSQCGGPLGGYKYTVQIDGNMAEYFVVPAAFSADAVQAHRPDAHDDAHLRVRRHPSSVRHDDDQRGRDHQTADHLRLTPGGGRRLQTS